MISKLLVIIKYILWRVANRRKIITGHFNSGKAKIFYQISGQGYPLVFIHGGGAHIESFAGQIPYFSLTHKVIALDTRGHGRSSRGKKNFTYATMAEDIITMLDHLQIEQAKFVGWSDGGNAILLLSMEHPSVVNRMVLISANYNPEGLKQQNSAQSPDSEGLALVNPWLKFLYRFLSPHPAKWHSLTQELQTLWATEPQLNSKQLATVKTKTLIIGGENDLITAEHWADMQAHIPDSQLQIIPGTRHDPHLSHAQAVNDLIAKFIED